MRVKSLGQEGPLEEKMTAHSSALSWKISWTEEAVHGVTKESDTTEHEMRCVFTKKKTTGKFLSLPWNGRFLFDNSSSIL